MAKGTTESDRRATNGAVRARRPRKVTLTFEDHAAFDEGEDPKDLSAAARLGEALFLSCDAAAGIDRVTPIGRAWGDHRHYDLGAWIDLPGGNGGDTDIAGLDIDDGAGGPWLWVVGSHALSRGGPGAEDESAAALKALAKVKRHPNRAFLARIPLVWEEDGPRPVARDGKRRLAHVPLHKKKSALTGWLEGDPHLGPFLDLPSKENGFDIEGIAARDLRVWLGLRGPVLREMAVILELRFKIDGDGHLAPKKLDGKSRYRKHLVATGGQGIRDMAFDGDDLLILTGTVMTGDGPSEILRLADMPAREAAGVVPPKAVTKLAHMPNRGQVDHPEGLTRWTGEDDWLVVYDSPADARVKQNPARVTADIFTF